MILILLSTWLTACSGDPENSPEKAVLDTLNAIEVAAEARSLSNFMQHISDDYRDHHGNLKQDIQRIVQFQYIRNQQIHILSDVKSLVIDGTQATAQVNVAMAARAVDLENPVRGLRARTYHFSVLLTSDDEQQEWHIASVAWKQGWK